MGTLCVGIAGFGFVGPHHLDAIRRLGIADVTAVATSSLATARTKARTHRIEKAYGNWRLLVEDPEIDVIDIATPTHLHAPIALAAIKAGKHVIVDKPLALSSAEAAAMLSAARRARIVHAVLFNIRGNSLVQQARAMVSMGRIGEVRLVRGHYLQEWLLKETDFNWRLDPRRGGPLAMVADAGAHWYDLAQHVSGSRIARVLADLSNFMPTRRRPAGAQSEAFARASNGRSRPYAVRVPDLGLVLFEFENGARGEFATSALCPGHKNDLTIEVCGSHGSVRWEQERPDELWIGRRNEPNQLLRRDPHLLEAQARSHSSLPGGHAEGWADAFRTTMSKVLGFIAAKRDPAKAESAGIPTFGTGLEITRIVDAIAASAKAGGRWKSVARPAD